MNGHLILTDGTEAELKPADVEEALYAGKLLWVDLHDSSEESLALLAGPVQHPPARRGACRCPS